MKDEFSSGQIAKAIDVEYQRLRGWIDAGALTPSIRPADGVATRAIFNRTDAHMGGLLKECLALGMRRDEATLAVGQVRKALKLMRNPGAVLHVLFVKRNGKFFLPDKEPVFAKPHKTIADTFDEALKNGPLPSVILMNKEMFEELSLFDIMTWKGRFRRDAEYTSFVVINLQKIVKSIDLRL